MLTSKPVNPTLPAADLKRAREFYEGKLGFKPTKESADDVTYEAGGGTKLYIWQREGDQTDHTEAAFDVNDIEREVGELKERGVKFESYDMPGLKTDENNIATMDGSRSAWFKDTEGNIIAIVQM